MKINRGNTIIYAFFNPGSIDVNHNINNIKYPNNIPSPRLTIKGDRETAKVAKVVVRWSSLPFERSLMYRDILPILYKIFRRVYNENGYLRLALFDDVVKEELGDSSFSYQIAAYEIESPSRIFFTIQDNKKTIVFPTKVEVLWRPEILIRYLSEMPDRKQISNGYFLANARWTIDEMKRMKGIGEIQTEHLPYYKGQTIEGWTIKEDISYQYMENLLIVFKKKKVKRRIKLKQEKIKTTIALSTKRKINF